MSREPSRRTLIAAAGAAAVPLAGCSNIGSSPNGNNSTDTTTPTGTATGTDEPQQKKESPFDRGEVLEDFEDLSDWGTIAGSLNADTETVYAGTQSALVEGDGETAGIFKAYPDGIDLTKNDLSVAMQLKKPASGKLIVEMYAPGERNRAVTRRFLPEHLNGWVRFDVGYTSEPGTPDMSNVQELRFVVHSKEGSDVKFRLDGLRTLPKENDRGAVLLTFDDNFKSTYEVAYPELKERGWAGVSATIPHIVGNNGRTSVGELREMQSDGWDIASHPQLTDPSTPLPKLSEDEQRKVIKETKEWLELKGFEKGARFFVTPFDAMDDTTHELVQEFHDLGFIFGASNNAVPPSGRPNISRIYGRSDAFEADVRHLKLASRRRQMTVLAFHGIGADAAITKEDFTRLLDTIEKLDLDVVTASDIAGRY